MATIKTRKRTSQLPRVLLWGALGLWAMTLGAYYVTRPDPKAGQQVLDAAFTVRTVDGRTAPLLPRDSAVAVLAATSECAACRVGIPNYREIAERLKEQGVAFRVIVASDSLAAQQFSRLVPGAGPAVWDPDRKLLRKLGMHVVPSMRLVGRDGRLVASWLPLSSDSRTTQEITSAARMAASRQTKR